MHTVIATRHLIARTIIGLRRPSIGGRAGKWVGESAGRGGALVGVALRDLPRLAEVLVPVRVVVAREMHL